MKKKVKASAKKKLKRSNGKPIKHLRKEPEFDDPKLSAKALQDLKELSDEEKT